MIFFSRRGQSLIEYTVLFVVVLAAILAMQIYFKRGVQGRWKSAVDEMGDQYDPRSGSADIVHRINSTTETYIYTTTDNTNLGEWTKREDFADSTETKTGYMRTGGY